jgi:hypothetical protein
MAKIENIKVREVPKSGSIIISSIGTIKIKEALNNICHSDICGLEMILAIINIVMILAYSDG